MAPWGPGRAGVRDGVEREWRNCALCQVRRGQGLEGNQAENEGLCRGLGSGVASKPRASVVSSMGFLPWCGRCVLEAMGRGAPTVMVFPAVFTGKEVCIPHAWLRPERAELFKIHFSSNVLMIFRALAEVTCDSVSLFSKAPGYFSWHLIFKVENYERERERE